MNGSNAETKVGMTVVVAAVILVSALLWIKGVNWQGHYRDFAIWFPNVGALEIGDPVSVSGVRRGKVAAITLDRGGVRVRVRLAEDVDLRADAVFAIKNVGLMGERFISINMGNAPEPWPTDSIPHGFYETGIPEVMGLMGRVTGEIRELVKAIRCTIGSDETLSRLVTVSENLERLSDQAAGMIETQRTGISRTLEDLGVAARSLRETMDENRRTVTRTAQRFDSAAVKLNRFADRLDTLSGEVQSVVHDMRDGKGSMARLINDDQLVRRWESTAKEIDALVADIRANPKKYLHVQVRIF